MWLKGGMSIWPICLFCPVWRRKRYSTDNLLWWQLVSIVYTTSNSKIDSKSIHCNVSSLKLCILVRRFIIVTVISWSMIFNSFCSPMTPEKNNGHRGINIVTVNGTYSFKHAFCMFQPTTTTAFRLCYPFAEHSCFCR